MWPSTFFLFFSFWSLKHFMTKMGQRTNWPTSSSAKFIRLAQLSTKRALHGKTTPTSVGSYLVLGILLWAECSKSIFWKASNNWIWKMFEHKGTQTCYGQTTLGQFPGPLAWFSVAVIFLGQYLYLYQHEVENKRFNIQQEDCGRTCCGSLSCPLIFNFAVGSFCRDLKKKKEKKYFSTSLTGFVVALPPSSKLSPDVRWWRALSDGLNLN